VIQRSTSQALARHIATVFGLGDLLPAPGTTAGSLPAALLWWLLAATVDGSVEMIVVTAAGCLIFTLAGIWAADREGRRRGTSDPGPVVIDEVAGQWLTYLLVILFVSPADHAQLGLIVGSGFFLFRFFDIVKPWPAGRLEGLPGGVGIMADDLAAAGYAGLCLVLAARWLLSS
jgi:phosphatidylglycerophosphatase A